MRKMKTLRTSLVCKIAPANPLSTFLKSHDWRNYGVGRGGYHGIGRKIFSNVRAIRSSPAMRDKVGRCVFVSYRHANPITPTVKRR